VTKESAVVSGLKWILENRTRVVDGKEKKHNPTSFSAAAGLSRGHVEQILAGRHQGDVKRDTAIKIAKAGNVRVEWLLTGSGAREPFDESISDNVMPLRRVELVTDEYTSFRTWLAAGGKALDPAAVEAVQIEAQEKRADGDPGFDHWTERYKFFLGKKRSLDELREMSADDFE
jgi:transcriptional regulator with XRE-family HTH domain